MKKFFLTTVCLAVISARAWGQATGDYRSAATGDWNSASTWKIFTVLNTWVGAVSTPSSSDGVITVRNGHTVTVTAAVTVDQVVVDAGGQITLNSSVTLTIANGSGTDLDVSGMFKSAGTVTINSGATIAFNSGGKYQHNFTTTAGTIPTATWDNNSTVEIIGYTSNPSTPSGLAQSFGNFTWNCPSQTGNVNAAGNLTTINGKLTVTTTNTGSFRLSTSTSPKLNVGGDLVVTGGTLSICNGAGTPKVSVSGNVTVSGGTLNLGVTTGQTSTDTLSVTGNVTISGGTIDLKAASAAGSNTLLVGGDLAVSSGTLTQTGSTSGAEGLIKFTGGSGTSNWNYSGGTVTSTYINYEVGSSKTVALQNNVTVSSSRTLTVSGTLNCGTNLVTSTGAFTLASGATLGIGSTAGITSGTTASGNIQVTGTRTFDTGANYTYNGSSAQNTGNGLPSTVNNLTINNSSGVTLDASTTVSSTLTLTSGKLTTGSNTLTLGSSATLSGEAAGRYVIGNLTTTKTVGTGSSTLGGIGVSLDAGGGDDLGNVTVTRVSGSSGAVTVSGKTGINRKWTITSTNPPMGGRTLTLSWVSDDDNGKDLTTAQVWKSTDGGTTWATVGSPQDVSSTRSIANSVTSFSDYTVSDGSNPLPIQLASFSGSVMDGSNVKLDWSTVSEVNNYGFYVERRAESPAGGGMNFTDLPNSFVEGHGTTLQPQQYSWTHTNVAPGSYDYRLRQMDLDGSMSYSPAVSVTVENPTVVRDGEAVPAVFKLNQNYPNPFNPTTTVEFSVGKVEHVSVIIYNILGQEVAKLFDGIAEPGQYYKLNFDGSTLGSGLYFYRVVTDSHSEAKKMMLLK